MGFVSNSRGIGSCVSGTPSFVGQSDPYVSDLRQGEVPFSVRGSSISITEKSNRGNSSDSVDTRVLFSSLLGSHENSGNETCDRSLYSEQLPFGSPFQQIYQSLYSSRYVDHQTGPFGCLFPYPNFFGFQEISPICLEQQGLPVSGCSVWPGGCTTGFYSDFPDGDSSLAYSVGSSSFLSGRFYSEGIRFRNSFSSHLPVYQTSSGHRLPYFLEKISDTSFPIIPVFGGTLQERCRSDFSPKDKVQSLCQKILNFSNSPSDTARQFSQLLGFLNSLADVVPIGRLHIRPLQFFLQEHSDSASQVWEALVPILPVLLPHLDRWTRRENVLTGVALLHPVPSLTLHTDFSLQGWGAFLEGKSVLGVWSPISVTTFQDSSSFESSSASDGQYHSSGLFAESRRNSLSCSLSSLQRNSSPLSSIAHSSGSQAFSRDHQCTIRLSVSLPQSSQHRVGTTASSVRPHVDLFATSLNHKLETFVSPVLRSRRQVSLLGRNVCLRLSSIPLSSSSASQDQAIRLQDHSYCTSLAKTSMVSRTSASVLCQASKTSFQTRSSVSVQGKSGTSKARISSSSR